MAREPNNPASSPTCAGESDQELIAGAQTGNSAAFDRLVTRYRDRIYGALLQMVRNEQEADDLAQEVFLRAYRNLRGFQGKCAFFSWLYRIAINLVYTEAHRRARRRLIHEQAARERERDPGDQSRTPADLAEVGETDEMVRRALDQLVPRLKQVLILKEFDDLDVLEIAKLLGVPEGTVKSRLFKAREELRRLILKMREETLW